MRGGRRGAGVMFKGSHLGLMFIAGMNGINGLMTLLRNEKSETKGCDQLQKKEATGQSGVLKPGFQKH